MNKSVQIFDKDTLLSIPFEACVLYHGYDSIGGLSLGFRLLQWSLSYLTKGKNSPNRKDVVFRTAFPGPGLRDAVEMITRAVTEGRYFILDTAPEIAPEGVYGRMYFEIGVGDEFVKVCLKPNVIDKHFIDTGRLVKQGNASSQDLIRWKDLKFKLSEKVWSVENFSDVLVKC